MRRKSERNKTTSTSSGSPEKKAQPRRGGRRSVAQTGEEPEEKPQQTDEEQQAESEGESSSVVDEPVVAKGRKKTTRAKAGSEDREDPRPSRSRRRTVQPNYSEILVEEEDGESTADTENGQSSTPSTVDDVPEANEEVAPEKVKSKSSSPKKRSKNIDVPEKVVEKTVPKESTPPPVKEEEVLEIIATSSSPSPTKVTPPVETSSVNQGEAPPETSPVPSTEQPAKEKSPEPETEQLPPPQKIPEEKSEKSAVETPTENDKVDTTSPKSEESKPSAPEPEEVKPSTTEPEPQLTTHDSSDAPEPQAKEPTAEKEENKQTSETTESPSEQVANTEQDAKSEPVVKSATPEPETKPSSTEKKSPSKSRRRSSSSSSSSDSSDHESSKRRGRKPSKLVERSPGKTKTTTEKMEVDGGADSEPVQAVEQKSISTESQESKTIEAKTVVVEKENQAVGSANVPAKQPKLLRKRKWLTKSSTDAKPQILAISTDSLKNLISDVRPVPLCDVKLDLSPEPESNDDSSDEIEPIKRTIRNTPRDPSEERSKIVVVTAKPARDAVVGPVEDKPARKVVLLNEATNNGTAEVAANKVARPPSPAKFHSSSILYITNLVRPFTVLQLKGLLARTGKLCENGFWIDKIKSRCYVKYETEDEAVETRHALHGVRWPTSNPKCLNVDFGSEDTMDKAIASTLDADANQAKGAREERVSSGWERFEADEKRDKPANRPVREWDLGKKEEPGERGVGRGAGADAVGGGAAVERDVAGSDRARESERGDRHKRSPERGTRRSPTQSPVRKFQKKENEPPLRLLDDLFRKTKSTPCIYWLPLTAEQISVKEEARSLQMAEHRRKIDENLQKEKERQREREKEREREREKQRDREKDRGRNRSADRRRDTSRSRERGGGGGGDRDRDRRRY